MKKIPNLVGSRLYLVRIGLQITAFGQVRAAEGSTEN